MRVTAPVINALSYNLKLSFENRQHRERPGLISFTTLPIITGEHPDDEDAVFFEVA